MPEDPRTDRAAEAATTERGDTPAEARTGTPLLQSLDLGSDAAIGMVCDIDDPDCNPMAFAGTDGAPAMTGGTDEA
ncbi:MAG: hypothetical protein AB7G21_01395 [Dehalococcoidia bacterium]